MTDRQNLLEQLLSFVEASTGSRPEQADENSSLREELALDSVDLVGVVMRIEAEFRIRLTHAELEQMTTVGSLLDLVDSKRAALAASISHLRAA